MAPKPFTRSLVAFCWASLPNSTSVMPPFAASTAHFASCSEAGAEDIVDELLSGNILSFTFCALSTLSVYEELLLQATNTPAQPIHRMPINFFITWIFEYNNFNNCFYYKPQAITQNAF